MGSVAAAAILSSPVTINNTATQQHQLDNTWFNNTGGTRTLPGDNITAPWTSRNNRTLSTTTTWSKGERSKTLRLAKPLNWPKAISKERWKTQSELLLTKLV